MTPIKCVETAITGTQPPMIRPGFSWIAVDIQFVEGIGIQTKWALVSDEASTANPSEADIAERVRLLRKSAQGLRKPSAASDGCFGLCSWGGCFWVLDLTSSPIWKEVGVELWPFEIERVAIRQLLAERGAK